MSELFRAMVAAQILYERTTGKARDKPLSVEEFKQLYADRQRHPSNDP
jgi:hypothetical protein